MPYSSINIVLGNQAVAGTQVGFTTHIKNIWSGPIRFWVSIWVADAYLTDREYNIAAGQTVSITNNFTMPNYDTTVFCQIWYQASDGNFYVDNTANATIAVYVPQVYYTLNLNGGGGGSVSPAGNTQHLAGSWLNISAVPNSGFQFKYWQENGQTISTNPNQAIQMNSNRSISGYFELAPAYTLTLIVNGNGTTIKDPDKTAYSSGEQVTVSAIAGSGYEFDGWYENGVKLSGSTYMFLTINSNRTLTANFILSAIHFTVTITPPDHGTVSGAGVYSAGSSVTLNAWPGSGYEFKGWYEGATLISTNASYTFTINANRTFTASFELISTDVWYPMLSAIPSMAITMAVPVQVWQPMLSAIPAINIAVTVPIELWQPMLTILPAVNITKEEPVSEGWFPMLAILPRVNKPLLPGAPDGETNWLPWVIGGVGVAAAIAIAASPKKSDKSPAKRK